jgi:LysM repeat protein
MLSRTQENQWVRRTRWLTQALIISGTLNIGLIATFFTSVLKEKQESLAIELKPKELTPVPASPLSNSDLLRAYSLLPFQELLLRLDQTEHVEEGLTKRDLALTCLVAFHHFNLEQAIGNAPIQKRTLLFSNPDAQESIELAVFPGIADEQFQAMVQYAKTEKWPLTSQGLFYELKRSLIPRDPSLVDAFSFSSEYHAVDTLFSKTNLTLPRDQLIDLITEGDWKTLSEFTQSQRQALDLSTDRRRTFLLTMLKHRSPTAAQLLLSSDLEFALKRLDDTAILTILDLLPSPTLEPFAKELLASPRADAVWQRSATHLYALSGDTLPQPYNHKAALARFLPPALTTVKEAIKAAAPKKKIHVIETGDTLWTIARKYRVSIDEIKRINHLETEKIRPGKQLEIPEKT